MPFSVHKHLREVSDVRVRDIVEQHTDDRQQDQEQDTGEDDGGEAQIARLLRQVGNGLHVSGIVAGGHGAGLLQLVLQMPNTAPQGLQFVVHGIGADIRLQFPSDDTGYKLVRRLIFDVAVRVVQNAVERSNGDPGLGREFRISQLVVREEADVDKVARKLYTMQKTKARGKGVVVA